MPSVSMPTIASTFTWSAPVKPATITTNVADEKFISFVRTSLENKVKGDTRGYSLMIEMLGKKLDDESAVRWFSALVQNVSLIRYQDYHRQLVHIALAFDWNASEDAINAFGRFVADLACCNGLMLRQVLIVLVRRLLCFFDATPSEESTLPCKHLVDSEETACRIHDGVHRVLKRLLKVIPSASTTLFPILVDQFPYRTKSTLLHLTYIKNLLRLSEYVPELLERILEVTIQRIVLIDVELKQFVVAVPTTDIDNDLNMILRDDDDDDDDDAEDNDDDDEAIAIEDTATHPKHIDEPLPEPIAQTPEADKLDRCLALLFRYIDLVRRRSSALCERVFEALLHTFDSSIVTTFGSRHAQYLLFYMCTFRNAFAETFLRRLMERMFDSTENVPVRTSCSLYVASFISRCKSVRYATRMHCFEAILRWIHSYVDIHEEECRETSSRGDSEQHIVFYSLCQSMMYIFCQWRSEFEALLEESASLSDFFNFSAIFGTSLNPLRFCCDDVVAEFSTTTLALRLGDCYQVIRRNQMLATPPPRTRPPSTFPFEVCNLVACASFIEPCFEHRAPQQRHQHHSNHAILSP